jgi:hypothetical protein
MRNEREVSTNGTAANLGFEREPWKAADALRSNMDAAEYKHVVLGLIFLKYISDAFEEKHAQLEAERDQGIGAPGKSEMRALAEAYPDFEFVQQAVAQIPWGHNVRILDKISDPAERQSNRDSTNGKGRPSRISPGRFRRRRPTWPNRLSRTPTCSTSWRWPTMRMSVSWSEGFSTTFVNFSWNSAGALLLSETKCIWRLEAMIIILNFSPTIEEIEAELGGMVKEEKPE